MSTQNSHTRSLSPRAELSADMLGYFAIVICLFAPYFAIPVALAARRRARTAGIRSTAADWGWNLSIALTVFYGLVVLGGFAVSLLFPLLQ